MQDVLWDAGLLSPTHFPEEAEVCEYQMSLSLEQDPSDKDSSSDWDLSDDEMATFEAGY